MYLEKPVPTDEVCEFEGKTYRWFRNEHCMVMCGFDKENGTVLIQDPLDGLVERDAETFAKYYEELGKKCNDHSLRDCILLLFLVCLFQGGCGLWEKSMSI